MSDASATRALGDLARAYGVQPSFVDASGRRVRAAARGLVAALRALGAEVDAPADAARALRARRRELDSRVVEPVVVAWDGRLRGVPVRASRSARISIQLEAGGSVAVDQTAGRGARSVTVSALERLPIGYHTLSIETRSARWDATVFSAPTRAPAIAAGSWAPFAPLYGLRSNDDWGIGSFTELGAFDRWAGERGARMLSTLPLFAAFLDEPFEPSPYAPASRLFWNEVFVDVDRAGEADPGASTEPGVRPPPEVRHAALVDYRAVAAAKRAAVEPLAERFFRAGATERYRAFVERTPEVREYARFRAEVDRRRIWWGDWPAAEREGRLSGDPESDASGRYHLYAQWLAREQLASVGERAKAEGRGLYLDLPIGVSGASYDVWRHRGAFAGGCSVGAPPDAFFSSGQDWGFPPPHPERVREDAYAYPRAVVANLLRHASALRIDHVMALHRLYWVPRNADARHGAYVRYRADEWYAMLSIEARRAGAAIVGEDLGTVPAYVRRAMRRHGIHTSYVIQFETGVGSGAGRADVAGQLSGALRDPPAGCVASLGTHDLPSWAAFWGGDDIERLVDLGLVGSGEAARRADERTPVRDAIVDGLRRRGLLGDRPPDAEAVLEAALSFLGRSAAALVVVTLEDLWLERRPQNVPGTGADFPNWRRRLRPTLGELSVDERVVRLIGALARERARAAASAAA